MSVSSSIRLLTLQRTRALVAFLLGALLFFTYLSSIWLRHGKRDGNSFGINNASSINATVRAAWRALLKTPGNGIITIVMII